VVMQCGHLEAAIQRRTHHRIYFILEKHEYRP
jgi:hypothetical protein